MKKKISKKFIVVIVALPLVIVLAWLLYTNKISFNFLSHASATPDYIVCPEDSNGNDCTILYSGGQGLFKLFYDSSVALDLNKDGKIYIKIMEGKYTLDQQSLSSIANQERAWIVIKDQSKSVLIEGSGAVVLDGSANIGGVYLKNSKDVTISGISFANLIYSSTKCTGIVESCPVGRGIVLDGSKLLFEKSSILDAQNGSVVSLGASELIVDGSEIVNKVGVGIQAKGSSKIVIKNKAVITSNDSNAISLEGTATLTTSSTIDRNEISRTKSGSGVTGFTIYANGTMPLNLDKVNIQSYGGGLLASGGVDVKLSDSQITSRLVKKDSLISLKDSSKISSMEKTLLTGGLYGILLGETTQVTAISASDISKNSYGIYIAGGIDNSKLAKVSSIKTTTFKENTYGLYLKNRAEVTVDKGTIFEANTSYGIYSAQDSYLKKITVQDAEFKNNALGILSYAKASPSGSDLIIKGSKFSGLSTLTQTAVSITGKSTVSIEDTSFDALLSGIKLASTGKLSVMDSSFSNNKVGVRVINSEGVQLYRNKFISNTEYGVSVGVSTNTDVRNNIFDGNKIGIYFGGNYEGSLINNVLANSKTSAATFAKDTNLVKDYNNVYYKNVKHVTAVGTKLQSVSGFNVYYPSASTLFIKFTPQITSIKIDPKLDESTWKPLSTDSVVINAGNPDPMYNDLDKSRNDIGITGGPKAISTGVIPPEVVFSAIWSFNEAQDDSCTGGADVCDSGAKGFHGNVKGVATKVPTMNGLGRDFDGKTGTYIEIGDKSEFELQTFTIEAVVKKEGDSGAYENNYTILSKGGSGFEGFKFGLKGTNSFPIIILNDSYSKQGKTVIEKNKWYHLAVVVDGGAKKVSLYVNGVLDVTDSFSDPIKYEDAKVKIGNGNGNNDLGLDGVLDNVAFYSKVRTADEIHASYEAMVGTVSDTCGNGARETSKGEKCDDGNLKDGDGCNSKCKYEADLNKDGMVSISGDYVPLYKAIKKYLSERKVTDTTYDLNGDGAITINGDYIIFLKVYKYYLKSLL